MFCCSKEILYKSCGIMDVFLLKIRCGSSSGGGIHQVDHEALVKEEGTPSFPPIRCIKPALMPLLDACMSEFPVLECSIPDHSGLLRGRKREDTRGCLRPPVSNTQCMSGLSSCIHRGATLHLSRRLLRHRNIVDDMVFRLYVSHKTYYLGSRFLPS